MKRMIVLCILTMLCGCAPKEPNVSISDVEKAITSEINIEKAIVTDLRGNMDAAERYGIPLGKIEGGFVYTSEESGKNADEIIIVKLKDRRSVSEVEGALESEITGLTMAWENAGKEEYDKVQGHVLRTKGRYVMLAITSEHKRVEELFNDLLK